MNNNQFRKLVLDQSGQKQDGEPKTSSSTLGGKRSGLMPMTPRTLKGGSDVDFARQVRERNSALQPTKKFRSSAPKGSRFAAGYTDRAKARTEAEEVEDDKAERIKALEEQAKLGQISPELFESLRDQITGGDVSSTHLVKGLDRQLLERVRRGENVFESAPKTNGPAADVDDELDKLGEKDVEAVKRDRAEKRGSLAGRKRTRDEIMAELKAQRAAAKEAAKVVLDQSKWRKVGDAQKSRTEIDHKGREVLITVDEDGLVKKKVRKVQIAAPIQDDDDTPKVILGEDAIVPKMEVAAPAPDDSDDDIFENVGTAYNPLGDDDSDDGAHDPNSDAQVARKAGVEDQAAKQQRNYFGDKPAESQETEADRRIGIESIIKKAAKMDPSQRHGELGPEDDESDQEKRARLKKRAQMLAQEDRDMDDMDMGFGSSRFEDEEEGGDGSKVRLSQWKGIAGDDDEGPEKGDNGGGKKKRKPKKRKGDVNNAADIMRVIEGRKSAGK